MRSIFDRIVEVIDSGARAALATVIGTKGSTPGKVGMRILVLEDGPSLGTVGGGKIEAEVCALAKRVMETCEPARETYDLVPGQGLLCGGSMEVYVEPIGGPAVYVFGAGHIGQSLARVLDAVGMATTVIDDRQEYADVKRFPHGCRVLVEDFSAAFDRLTIHRDSFIVIATRGHEHDREVLAGAIRTGAAYIGLIASRGKVREMTRWLGERGVAEDEIRRVRMPVGLDIGAQTPGEIAVSIVAEIIAERRRSQTKGGDPSRPLAGTGS